MKSRLLAAFLSISMLFSSMPVTAAEPETGISSAGETITANQEETETTSIEGDTVEEPSVEESSNGDSSDNDVNNEDDTQNPSTDGNDENDSEKTDEGGDTVKPDTGNEEGTEEPEEPVLEEEAEESLTVEEQDATASFDVDIVYSAGISEDGKSLELKVEVSGYKGDAIYAYLNYEYTNALGEKELPPKRFLSLVDIEADENTEKAFNIESSLALSAGLFEANTEYDITMWLEIGNNTVSKEVKTVKTPVAAFAADKLTFNVEQDINAPTTANYTVGIEGLDTDVPYYVLYKQTGSKEPYTTVSASNAVLSQTVPQRTDTINTLQEGVEYEFVAIVGGVKKSVIKQIGTAGVKLSKVGNDEINALDFVRTYKLESVGEESGLSGSYSLSLAYFNNKYGSYSTIGSPITFSESNEYQAQIKTASSGTKLSPDTDYDLRWVITDSNGNVVYTSYETIHTKKVTITFKLARSYASLQEYQLVLDRQDIANFEGFFNLILTGYVKKEGSADYSENRSLAISSSNTPQYSGNITFSGLEANTSYEASLRDYYGAEYAATTFKTPENYTFEFTTDSSKITDDTGVVAVTAKGGTDDDRLKVVFSLSDGHGDEHEQTVILKKSEEYKNDVTFTGLTSDTEYTITNAKVSVMEGTSYINIGDVECNHKFRTKATEIPTEIKLSKTNLALNAVYSSWTAYYGYNRETLKAEVTPATAARDFIWSSNDSTVASVDSNGEVVAKSIGTAVITVASVHNPEVKAECKVTVKKYAVGHKENEDEAPEIKDGYYDGYSLYKNDDLGNLGLYEIDDMLNVTPLSDYTVTSANSKIAEWKNGSIHANAVGNTAMTFEKDGIKANLMISVTAEGKGFGITGFTTTYSLYPAIKEKDGSYTLAYQEGGSISYSANVEVSPKQDNCSESDFNWNISEQDREFAEVGVWGEITPKKAGTVTLTVKPKPDNCYTIGSKPYIKDEVKVTLNIKKLPTWDGSTLHALANVNTKIGDVAFPASWGEGWKWKYPDTPLVTNGVYSSNYYNFKAVYSGTEFYPCETTLSVYIGKVTGASVTETVSATDSTTAAGNTSHNQVLETGGDDVITLKVLPISQGWVSSDDYKVEIPNVDGLTIKENENKTFSIKANKKGSYTLKPVIKSAKDSNKVFARTSYKLKAVEEKQVGAITLKLVDGTENVQIPGNAVSGYALSFDKVDDKKDFTLKAEVKDRYGAAVETALTWKTTDKTVATVAPVSRSDTQSAKVTVKGDGHTVISVTAKDAAGFSQVLNLEIQDHRPRVETNKANVNIAYDYGNGYGQSYAASTGGLVEIVSVYEEYITPNNVELRDKEGKNPAPNLEIAYYGNSSSSYKFLIRPSSDALTAGKYDCIINVKTSAGNEYQYPIKVTVIDKAPSVSAKMGVTPNLFFKNTEAEVYINVSDNMVESISSVTWETASQDVDNGFKMKNWGSTSIKGKRQLCIRMSQQANLKFTNGKLTDPDVAKGTFKVKITGYKKEYVFNNFTLKYSYKKPVLVTMDASTNVFPSIGKNEAAFWVYDKTNKWLLRYNETSALSSASYYDEIKCDSTDITLTPYSYSNVAYSYSGTGNSKKFNIKLDAPLWREPLTAVHTVKVMQPSAYLSDTTLTYNTNLKSVVDDWIGIKNVDGWNATYTDIEIKGADVKSQKLLDDDLFIITTSGSKITIEQSQADLMGTSIPAGTYSYKVTPYCKKPGTNDSMKLNTMTLKIKVVNKAVTAKVSPKGSIDLTYGASSTPTDRKNTVALVDPKFSNLGTGYINLLGTGYSIADYNLIGEYSDYFDLNRSYITYTNKWGYHYYISISDRNPSKLKAGQAYKLAIEYTIENDDGEEFKVTSNTFTIKPKQSAPKVTVTNNNQTLYAGAGSSLTRSYTLSVPSYYSISSVSGSIDCNKDGKPDITVSGSSTSVTVSISDKDAVGATANGKSYSIPVTVQLRGRDGIAKDVKTTIKVKVKR